MHRVGLFALKLLAAKLWCSRAIRGTPRTRRPGEGRKMLEYACEKCGRRMHGQWRLKPILSRPYFCWWCGCEFNCYTLGAIRSSWRMAFETYGIFVFWLLTVCVTFLLPEGDFRQFYFLVSI